MNGMPGGRGGCRPILIRGGRWMLVALAGSVIAATLPPGPTSPLVGAAEPAVAVGVGGVQRTGFWTPVEAAAGAEGDRVWVEDADGQPVGSPPMGRPAGAGWRSCVRPGRPAAELIIRRPGSPHAAANAGNAHPPGDLIDRAVAATIVPSTTPLVLVEGRFPAAASAARLAAGDRAVAEIVPLVAARGVAPRTPLDLDAFGAAIISGGGAAGLPAETVEALDGWMRRGGRPVAAAGRPAIARAAGRSPAADWLPGTAPRAVPLRQFGALEAFAGAGGLAKRAPAGGIEVPRFEGPGGVSGVIEVFEGSRPEDLPLVVRRAHGLGVIAWIAIDIDERWFANWPACDRLLAALLSGRAASEGSLVVNQPGLRQAPDLAGQLRMTLEEDPGGEGGKSATAVPFEVIAGLGLLYVLALYPLDWWLVSRAGRPWLSWLTLPALAGGFTIAAWALGQSWGLGLPASIRTAEVLDIDADAGLVRGSAWAAVRSPTNGRIDLHVEPAEEVGGGGEAETAVSWFADSGRGFGGVDATVAHPSLAAGAYRYGATLGTLAGVPVAAASSRLFEAVWTARLAAPAVTGSLRRDARGLVHGVVAHHLPVPLTDCRLLHGGWLYDAGDLEPGEAFDVDAGRGPRSLSAAVTRRAAAGDRDRAEPWQTTGTGVDRILEVAGVYEAVGGFTYTNLEPGRLDRLDLSRLLTVDRAVLAGTAPPGFAGSTWEIRLAEGEGEGTKLSPPPTTAGPLVRIVIPLPAGPLETTPGANP